MNEPTKLSGADRSILLDLARRTVDIAADPVNLERKKRWYQLDADDDAQPMVLAEGFGVVDEKRALTDADLLCEDPWARGIEHGLRHQVYRFDVLKDDHVVEPHLTVGWHVGISDYGVRRVDHRAEDYDGMGSRSWDAPIVDLDKDFEKLQPRSRSVDRASTLAEKERLEELFGDILPVRIQGNIGWTMGMTMTAIDLIGLENLMLFMFDNPKGLHRLMAFLRDDHIEHGEWFEREGLLTPNNENHYIGSGSMGYTRHLPQSDWKKGEPVRTKDLWVLSESQETVGVGPDQFEEFIFPYQLSVAERYGKCYYGCCEPVNNRWHILKRLPNLARVSISPWADQAFMAEALGRDYVFSRKPNPSLISTTSFDEDAIRADLRETVTTAKDCRLELIMKDVHTLNNEPERLPRWVEIAREVIAETA